MKVKTSKRFSLQMLLCEAIERFLLVRLHDSRPFFYSAENAHAYEFGHVANGLFVLAILGRSLRVRLLPIGHWH